MIVESVLGNIAELPAEELAGLHVETVTLPIPENVEVYDRIIKTYSGLYQDLKQRFRTV